MKGKLIDNYKRWKKKENLPYAGLCRTLLCTKYQKTLELFQPSTNEAIKLDRQGECSVYWGSGLLSDGVLYALTPRREAIILFICAMHNEL